MLNHAHYYFDLSLTKWEREIFIFGITELNHGWYLISIIYHRKISLSQPLLSSKNIILRFVITAHRL